MDQLYSFVAFVKNKVFQSGSKHSKSDINNTIANPDPNNPTATSIQTLKTKTKTKNRTITVNENNTYNEVCILKESIHRYDSEVIKAKCVEIKTNEKLVHTQSNTFNSSIIHNNDDDFVVLKLLSQQ